MKRAACPRQANFSPKAKWRCVPVLCSVRMSWACASAAFIVFCCVSCGGGNNQKPQNNYYAQAKQFQIEGKMLQALDAYHKAIQQDEKNIELHRDYQNYMIKLGREAEVQKEYWDYSSNHPRVENEYLYYRLLKGETMEREMKRINRENPEFYWSRHALAYYFRDRRRYNDAAGQFTWIVEHRPTLENYLELAKCYQFAGRYEEEEQVLVKVRDMFPESPQPHFYLGTIYHLASNPLAVKELEQALAMDSTMYEIYPPLIQALHTAGKFEEAANRIQELGRIVKQKGLKALMTTTIHIADISGYKYVAAADFSLAEFRYRATFEKDDRLSTYTLGADGRVNLDNRALGNAASNDYKSFYLFVTNDFKTRNR